MMIISVDVSWSGRRAIQGMRRRRHVPPKKENYEDSLLGMRPVIRGRPIVLREFNYDLMSKWYQKLAYDKM